MRMAVSVHLPSFRRHLPFVLTMLAVMVALSTGLAAQGVTPLESAASKFYGMLARMFGATACSHTSTSPEPCVVATR